MTGPSSGPWRRRAARGVDVRVVLNGGYYSGHRATTPPPTRTCPRHGVHVRYTPTYFALTHQKTLTVDGRVVGDHDAELRRAVREHA